MLFAYRAWVFLRKEISILSEVDIDKPNTDYIGQEYNFNFISNIVIPERKSCKDDEIVTPGVVFTYGSKTSEGTGSGVFIAEFDYKEAISLDDVCSVFQEELVAIRRVSDFLVQMDVTDISISLYVDSQAAMKSLASIILSEVVRTCKETRKDVVSSLNSLGMYCVPWNVEIEDNEIADELARKGSTTSEKRVSIC